VVNLANSDNVSILWGGSNKLTLGANDVISDAGSNTTIVVGTVVGATTINNFGADTGGIIDLFNGIDGYTTTAAAYNALTSDGAGGLILPLGAFGSIDFAGDTSLSAANFKIN
jgi:hypothetical protein